jgi:hypothetical protein
MTEQVAPALRERINYWNGMGYRVVAETSTSAQLIRPRRFNPLEFVLMPVYAVEYLTQRDRQVYVWVEGGQVRESGNGTDVSRYVAAKRLPLGARLLIAAGVLVAILAALALLGAVAG